MHIEPLVSVIVIFLNAERFLRAALDSVFAQTYGHWELLLVDDGSTDASADVAREYVRHQPLRVRYFTHEGRRNRGMSASRNLGLSQARGEYIAFLDADDVWLPHKLAQQVAILQAHPEAAMVYGPCLSWYSWTGEPEDRRRDVVQRLNVPLDTVIEPPALVFLFMRNEDSVPSPSGIMVRRHIVASLGGFEEAFRGMYEDQVFYAKICLRAPVFVAKECWYKYRVHPESHCRVAIAEGRYYASRHTFLGWLEGYLAERGLKGGEVWRALQRQLFPYRHPRLHRLSVHARHPLESLQSLAKRIVWHALPPSAGARLRARWQRYRGHHEAAP